MTPLSALPVTPLASDEDFLQGVGIACHRRAATAYCCRETSGTHITNQPARIPPIHRIVPRIAIQVHAASIADIFCFPNQRNRWPRAGNVSSCVVG